DIAKRARIAVGTVYNHFDRKEDLLCALLEERTEALLAELAPRAKEPRDFAERLGLRIRRMLCYVEQHRGSFSILMGISGPEARPRSGAWGISGVPLARIQRFRAAFQSLVQEGLAEGALDPAWDATHLAAVLGGAIRAVTVDALIDEQ